MVPPHWCQSGTTTTDDGDAESKRNGSLASHLASRRHCQYHSSSLEQTEPASQPPVALVAADACQGPSTQAGLAVVSPLLPPSPLLLHPSPALPPHCLWSLNSGAATGAGAEVGARGPFPPSAEDDDDNAKEEEPEPPPIGAHFHHHSFTLAHSLPSPQQAPGHVASSHGATDDDGGGGCRRPRNLPSPEEPLQDPPAPPHCPQRGTRRGQ